MTNNNEEIKLDENVQNNPFKEGEMELKMEEENEMPEEEMEIKEEKTVDETEKIKKDYELLNNQYLRLAADFDNYRKRQAQERESLLKYGAEKTVSQLLEVLDNFDRGLKAIETVENCEKLKECYNLAYKNFNDALIKIGLETIKAIGEEFDPNMHEAVMQTPTSEHPENMIIAELQKGYMLGEKVLRPTLVNVATAE